MRRKPEINYLKIIKTAAGVVLSTLLAEAIGLESAASAGIIALLSIQDTKKETIRVVGKRIIAFGAALFFYAFFSYLIGFNVCSLGVFLLVFSPVCIAFGLSEGISTNTVLMCHFMAAGEITPPLIGNEFLLLLIGTGTGLLMNLYMPRQTERIRETQRRIEEMMRHILRMLAERLDAAGEGNGSVEEEISSLREILEEGQKRAYENAENHLLEDVRYYFRYMSLRRTQLLVLERIDEHQKKLGTCFLKHAGCIAGFLRHVSDSFHEYNNAEGLLNELAELKAAVRLDPLPREQAEFEQRAVLFQIITELEQFLTLKREFVRRLSQEDIRMFWNAS